MDRQRLFLASVGRRTASTPISSPPLGVLCLAAYVREQCSVEVQVADQRVEDLSNDQLVARIAEFRPHVIGLSAITPSAKRLATVTALLHTALPKTWIVVGGPHATALRGEILVDVAAIAAVAGEGERSLVSIMDAYPDLDALAEAPGLAWRDAAGRIVVNAGAAPVVEDLDALPFPAYDLLDPERYFAVIGMSLLPPGRRLALFTSRGCPYPCTFCHDIFGRRFRKQSPERIVAEIEYYQRRFGVEEVEFLDDVFNLEKARVFEFAQLAGSKRLSVRLHLPNGMRSDLVTEEVLDALVDAGLCRSAFALETGSPRLQALVRKRLDIPRFLQAVEWAVRRGVFAHGFAMLGFPTETEEELEMTVSTMCGSRLHTAVFFGVVPYPGTELHALAERLHPERMRGFTYEDTDCSSFPLNFSEIPDAAYFRQRRIAWRRFYLRPCRVGRIIRDYPHRRYLPRFAPLLIRRTIAGSKPDPRAVGGDSDTIR